MKVPIRPVPRIEQEIKRRAQGPTKDLSYPFAKVTRALAIGGQVQVDLSDAVGIFVFQLTAPNTPGTITMTLGDQDVQIPLFSGMFVKTGGFRRIILFNGDSKIINVGLLVSADPDFYVFNGAAGMIA